jgi:hypothetical protein
MSELGHCRCTGTLAERSLPLSVSLKEHLAPMELHRLLMDVRRRVEHEVTFEGKERRTEWVFA